MRICSPQVRLSPEATLGGEVYDREILKRLAGLGAQVEVILPAGLPHPQAPNLAFTHPPLRRGYRWFVSNPVFVPYIGKVYHKQPFDLLRVHSLRFVGPAAIWARRRYRLPVPVVAHHHHLDQDCLNPLIERRVIEACDLVTTDSVFSRDQLARELQVRTDHVSVVYAGIDERCKPQPKDQSLVAKLGLYGCQVLLFVGGLKPRKNVGLLLETFRDVVNELGDRVRLLIVGSGSEEARLRRKAGELGVADQVTFVGYVPESDKVRFYNLADVYVHTSRLEGFGMTVGEAMSCGKPVVATCVGSLPEVVTDGETGFLVPLANPRQFAERVVMLLRNEALAHQFGQAGMRRVETLFRWEMVAQRLMELYQQVLCDSPRRSIRGRSSVVAD